MTSALSPSVVAAIDDLELAARLVVEGLRAGGHRSPFHGYSAEFQQHRPYRAGDDLKYLDWKILARTDRLYSKQFRETTSMSVMLVLDASASMAFPDDGVSKFRYACLTTAALAYLISSQGDAVGLMTWAGGRLSYVPARGGRPHLRSLIAHIDRLNAEGQWDAPRAISRGADLLKRRGVVLVLSDFYDAEEETRRELRRVIRRGHDVSMLQVMSPEETQLAYRGDLEFEDLESSERRLLDARAVSAQYNTAVGEFLSRCRAGAHRDGVDYTLMQTDVPPERALRDYLLQRGAQHHARHGARWGAR
ncbi:MAG TPA: DUF58 domain-containing protein [Gemmatimonadaceae bacterium]|nr:DUF58 domain-containing protein [Gemmatimonadaceae bacterium]